MDSKHIEEELSSYLSGELSASETEAVEKHLADCALCSDQLKALEQLNGLLSDADEIQPTARFAREVLGRVDEERRVVAFRSRRTIVWLAAAAAIAFVVLLLSIQKETQPPSSISHWKPKIESPAPPPVPNTPPANKVGADKVSPEDAELIAHLDALENMDLIENYDNLEYMEAALLAGEQGKEE
jgi:hypothetical protein